MSPEQFTDADAARLLDGSPGARPIGIRGRPASRGPGRGPAPGRAHGRMRGGIAASGGRAPRRLPAQEREEKVTKDYLTPEQRERMGLGQPAKPTTAEQVRKAAGMSRSEWEIWSEATNAEDAAEMLASLESVRDEKRRAELREQIEQLEGMDE